MFPFKKSLNITNQSLGYRTLCRPIRFVMVLVIKRIGLGATQSSDFVDHSYEYWLNWTPLSHITIINGTMVH